MSGQNSGKQAASSDYFIDKEHDAYRNNPLKQIDARFNGNQTDIQILARLYSNILQDKLVSFTVEKAFKAANELAHAVDFRARGIDTCFIEFAKGAEGMDTALMKFSVSQYWFYFMYP
jgi:hypothetical protein